MSDEKIVVLFQRYNELLVDLLQESSMLIEPMLRRALFQSLAEVYNMDRTELIEYPSTSKEEGEVLQPVS